MLCILSPTEFKEFLENTKKTLIESKINSQIGLSFLENYFKIIFQMNIIFQTSNKAILTYDCETNKWIVLNNTRELAEYLYNKINWKEIDNLVKKS